MSIGCGRGTLASSAIEESVQKRSNVFKWQVISNVSISSTNISEHTA